MRILKGEKKGFGYVFPNGNDWNYQYWVEIDFDLTGVDADPEWVGRHSPDPERPNLRTIRHENFANLGEAEAYLAAWTPELMKRYVSKPRLWWCFSTAVHSRGWMTKSGKAKWWRTYAKNGWLFAAMNTNDADWRHGITHEWLYDMVLWETNGRSHEQGKWWEPGEAPQEVRRNYAKMEQVKLHLESPECPAPLRKWYDGMRER